MHRQASQVAHMLRTRRDADDGTSSVQWSPSHHGMQKSPSHHGIQKLPSHHGVQVSPSHYHGLHVSPGHHGQSGDTKGNASHQLEQYDSQSSPPKKETSQIKHLLGSERDRDDDYATNDTKNDAICLTEDRVPKKSMNDGPIIELRGREVMFAIFVFFFFSLCVGLIVVVASNQGKLTTLQQQIKKLKYKKESSNNGNVCITSECVRLAAQLLHIMDKTEEPCEDFWRYSCGGWLDGSPIPTDRQRWGIDSRLKDKILVSVQQSLESPIQRNSSSSERKAKVMYRSCLDTEAIDSLGLKPFNDVIDKYGGWAIHDSFNIAEKNGRWNFQGMLADLHFMYRTNALFVVYVQPDELTVDTNIIMLDQNGLGLESQDYVNENSNSVTHAYMDYMRQSALAMGASQHNAEQFVHDTFYFEKRLASLYVPEEMMAMADAGSLYQKITIGQLQKLSPRIDWLRLLGHTFDHLTINTHVAVTNTEYLTNVSDLVQHTDDRILNYYLVWRFIQTYGEALPRPLRLAKQIFNQATTGTTEKEARWQHCVDVTSEWMGMAVGAMYVNNNLPDQDRFMVREMALHLNKTFQASIDKSIWMDDVTRDAARHKLELMAHDIGYPDFLKNWTAVDAMYSDLIVPENDSYFQVAILRAQSETHRMLRHLQGTTHNAQQWDVNPHVPNAFYSVTENKIVFPAGLLQPPYFIAGAPRFMNYGGIGYSIAHEMVHGFDNFGSAFDAEGNMRPWGSEGSWIRFRNGSSCLAQYYSSFKETGMQINGDLTLNENLADIVGLRTSYNAYVKLQEEDDILPGLLLTAPQTFFVAFAQNWCVKRRPGNMAVKVATSPHAPERVRVMGTLSQMPEFAVAFNCSVDARLRLPAEQICSVW